MQQILFQTLQSLCSRQVSCMATSNFKGSRKDTASCPLDIELDILGEGHRRGLTSPTEWLLTLSWILLTVSLLTELVHRIIST